MNENIIVKKQKKSPQLSIISIVSNEKQFTEWLADGLQLQVFDDYELIIVRNENNRSYKDARTALNDASKIAKGKYLVYMHQDVRFLSETALLNIYEYAERMTGFGVLGVAGAPEDCRKPICASIVHGKNKEVPGIKVDSPTEVMTVDECLFVIERETWEKHHFSAISGWHLYAVEYCLDMLNAGKKNYIIPIRAWHASDGTSAGPEYCKALKPFLKQYHNKFKCINTTMKPWKTGWTGRSYLLYYTVKQYIKKLVIR